MHIRPMRLGMRALFPILLTLMAPSRDARAFNVASVTEPPLPLVSGANHTCAVMKDRTVRCWGSPSDARLGIGRCRAGELGPAQVRGLGHVTLLAIGDAHGCALLETGEVRCWGNNDHGQLGDQTTRDRCQNVRARGLAGKVKGLAAGFSHSCAIVEPGRVMCWGNAAGGRMGNGKKTGTEVTPVFVHGIETARAIAAGDAHTCAVLTDTTVRCWGENYFDQLGNGGKGSEALPVEVSGLSGVTGLATGATHTCAILATGEIRCWGHNGRGQMGDGAFGRRTRPTMVAGLAGMTGLGSGAAHVCAVTTHGELACWGSNWSLQLGAGPGPDRPLPQWLDPRHGEVLAVVGGDFHTCAWYRDGAVRCWGENTFGQLGTGRAGEVEPLPVRVGIDDLLPRTSR